MQVFDLVWVRWLVAMVLGGIGLAFALYLAFSPSFARPEGEELEQYAAGIQVGRRPIPGVLILLFAVVGIVMIAYLVHAWTSGAGF